MTLPTPSLNATLPIRPADFGTMVEALDYAAGGDTGINFYSGKGDLIEALTYQNLRDQAKQLAHRLLNAGLQRGDRVALIAESDGDFARSFFACQYAGLVPAPMPLPAAFGGKETYVAHIRRMIESADASAAFGPASLEAWLADAAQGLKLKISGTLKDPDRFPAEGKALAAPTGDDLAYIQFSSGSTRFPLGVMVTQRALMANAFANAHHGIKLRKGDRTVSWLPFYHDMGLIGFLLTPIACQNSVDILPTREFARRPLVWLSLMSRNRASLSYSPSFGYELCARRAETAPIDHLDLSAWRVAGIGGDMIRPEILARFAKQFAPQGFRSEAFVASYGMAETTLALSFAPLERGIRTDTIDTTILEQNHLAQPSEPGTERTREFVACGPALPLHQLEVRDPEGKALPSRHVGRVFAHGPSMMQGYFGNQDETQRVLSADGWLDTGDLGYMLDGEIIITGRAKDLIIINGRNIWPQDLEWTAENEVEALRSGDVAVFSTDIDTNEKIVALVQCRALTPEARDSLKLSVAGVLRARHGVDASVVLVPPRSLPQTSSGKLSRSKAKSMFREGQFASAPTPSLAS
jgi:fatty-acyl-CoA synthase